MGDIQITRYPDPDHLGHTGYIEPRDRSWIVFLDKDGVPSVYWSKRDEEGAVIGKPIHL